MHASGERPYRTTRGQGGARAQLAAVGELIRPDLNLGEKRSKTKAIPTNVPVNAMAPPAKQHRGVRPIFFISTLSTIATNANI